MTLTVLIYVLMTATFVALAGVLAFDAVTAVLRWSAHRPTHGAHTAQRRPATSGARRTATTES